MRTSLQTSGVRSEGLPVAVPVALAERGEGARVGGGGDIGKQIINICHVNRISYARAICGRVRRNMLPVRENTQRVRTEEVQPALNLPPSTLTGTRFVMGPAFTHVCPDVR